MSWMDSWSRPSKSQATPAPFYLRPGGEDTPYCRTCGRAIGSRKTAETAASSTPAKYCSSRCRSQKPGALDRDIESVFVRFLDGEERLPDDFKGGKTEKKGACKKDARILVPVSAVEKVVFGDQSSSQEGRDAEGSTERELESNDGPTSKPVGTVSSSEALDSHTLDIPPHADGHRIAALSVRSGTRVRPAQDISEVNGSVGGEKGRAERKVETSEMLKKRLDGQKRAKHTELVRSAARRGVVFGFVVGDQVRKCEAILHGSIVEPSFAKGDWSIRWRE